MIIPVILAGGSGSRLWPLSRSAYPKQLLPLASEHTLLQDTVLRALSIDQKISPIIICNQEHRFLVSEQLQQIGINNAYIILEPESKNTAPAVTIAALFAEQQFGSDVTLMVLPADHLITNVERFTETVNIAETYAKSGKIVAFGIQPSQSETGYGYIKVAANNGDHSIYPVLEFVEKPSLERAKQYIASNQYYWNSGILISQASILLNEIKHYSNDVLQACQKALTKLTNDLEFFRLDQAAFSMCPNISFDYAVMEKTNKVMLVPFNVAWSDIGSWLALFQTQTPDKNGNVIQGDVFTENTYGSYLRAESRMLAVVGVKDHIIVETADAVLVAHKDESQSVKNIVNQLKQQQRSETALHRRVYRPWGHYEIIDKSEFFQVKHITVKAKASLSLQTHQYRSEHWVVVNGIAEVTKNNDIFTISANESTYIPQRVKHRLANPGETPLEIIEVQSGSYLGEDDIVRYDDVYGRAEKLHS